MRAGVSLLVAFMLLVTACDAPSRAHSKAGSPNPAGFSTDSPNPSDAASAGTSPEPTPITTTASDARTTPVTTIAGLSCRLPVAMDGQTPPAGFVSFPSGQLRPDPSSQLRETSGYVQVTVTRPVLDGDSETPVYDWQLRRWVPVRSPQVVSPDGSAYVYTQEYGAGGAMFANRLRIVSVATGSDRLLYTGEFADAPIAWTNAGIYDVAIRFESPSSGLWLIDPVTGSARTITRTGDWRVISNGAAWGFTGPAFGPTGEQPHTIDRLDLATGKVTNWYSAPSPHNVHVAGLDTAGRPVIVVDQYHVFRLLGPYQAQAMFNSPVSLWYGIMLQLDSHGLWFTSYDGDPREGTPLVSDVWLYSYATGLRKVKEISSDYPIQAITGIAGPCQ